MRRTVDFRLFLAAVGVAIALAAALVVSLVSGGGDSGLRAVVAPAEHLVAVPFHRGRRARDRSDRIALGPALQRLAGRDASLISVALRRAPSVAGGLPRRREIALTFDDGPSPYTEAIVRILLRMHAPATFFVVGQQLHYFSDGLEDEIEHGFELGDHTENHALLSVLRARAQYTQIHDDAIRMERLGAPTPRLFRPPYGAYNRTTLRILRRLGMLMVLWSIDPGDWRRPGTLAIVHNVLANSRPGAIALLHDGGGDRSQTIAALPAIIRGLRRRKYKLVSVARLVRDDPPPRHPPLTRLSGG